MFPRYKGFYHTAFIHMKRIFPLGITLENWSSEVTWLLPYKYYVHYETLYDRIKMGNSPSGIAVEDNKKTGVEGSQSQPQSIRPAAEVQPQKEAEIDPTRVKQTISHEHELIIQEEGTSSNKNLSTDDKLHDRLYDGVFSNQMKEASSYHHLPDYDNSFIVFMPFLLVL